MEGMGLNVDGDVVGADDMYSLEWNNYNFHLASRIQNLYEDQRLADVTLACEGKYLKAHKFLLCLCSSYFNRLFDANAQEKGNTIVILNSVRFSDLQNIMCFMYTGKVQIPGLELQDFLKIGQLLEVEGLNAIITHTGEDEVNELFRKSASQNDTQENEASVSPVVENVRRVASALRKRGKGNEKKNTKRLREEVESSTHTDGTRDAVVHNFTSTHENDLGEVNGIEYMTEDVAEMKYQIYDVRTEPIVTLSTDSQSVGSAEEKSIEFVNKRAPASSETIVSTENSYPMRRVTRQDSSEKRKGFDATGGPEMKLEAESIPDSFLQDVTENTFEMANKTQVPETPVEENLVSGGGARIPMGRYQKAAESSIIVARGSHSKGANHPLNGEENAVTINDSFYTRKIGRKRLIVYFCKHCHEEIRFKSQAVTHLHNECPAVRDGKVRILAPRKI